MSRKILYRLLFTLLLSVLGIAPGWSQVTPYPDQQFIIEGADSLMRGAELLQNISATADQTGIQLESGALTGYIFLKVQSAPYPFDIGLPSWNGTAPDENSGFRVFMRVPYNSGWSPWLEVGYWKENIWSGGKATQFAGGEIDIDTVILYSFATTWQFAIEMKRTSTAVPSPTLSLLSFFTSDNRTTQNIDYNAILNDNPAPIFIPTTFLHQYSLSSEIGGSICSPTTVSMILLSYGIDVDPLKFAEDTYDPYYGLFGVWPRVVQNASEYGLRGTVTRYRTWSEARAVLANGGRIGMSVGQPLYGGHLMMLAGFTSDGRPIIHDPAKSNGYGYIFNESSLAHSWFDKGGIAYTFYLADSSFIDVQRADHTDELPMTHFILHPNYPNPFNASTTFFYELQESGHIAFHIYNMLGELVATLDEADKPAGAYRLTWDGRDAAGNSVSTGGYVYQLIFNQRYMKTGKLLYLK